MRLLSAFIEGFGGITKRQYRFDEGLSEILADNGTGKSTLAAFIKAMLYGLEGTRNTKELESNEFRLYAPWDGGRFGGTLTLASRLGEFRIERYFDTKNKQAGELTVIDLATEKPTAALGEIPGYTLFKVNGESFLMTAYLSSLGITAGKTADISAKLTGVDGESWDMNKYDKAVSLLEKKRKEIQLFKGRGKSASLTLKEQERDALRDRLLEAKAAKAAADELLPTIREARATQASLSDSVKHLRDEIAARAAARTAAAEREKQAAALAERIARAEDGVKAARAAFPADVPNDIALDRLAADLQDYDTRSHRVAAYSPLPDLPSEEALNECEARLREAEQAKLTLSALKRPEAQGAGGGHTATLLWVLAAILAVVGGILLALLPLVGGILLAAAAIPAVLAVLCVRKTRTERARLALEAEAYRNAEEASAQAQERARTALAEHGVEATDLAGITALRVRRAEIAARAETEARERAELSAQRDAILTMLKTYGVGELDGSVALNTLRERRQSLRDAEAALALLQRQSGESVTPESAPYEADPAKDAELEEALKAKSAEYDELTAEIARAERREEEYRRLADTQDELTDALEAKEEECRALLHRMEVLDKAREYLALAREALEVRCFGGLRERLAEYNARLLAARGITMRLDSELCLTLSENGEDGKAHELYYYSTGLRAIADVCLRLALTDELFSEEAPPLILDDPFMALDGENLTAARDLLHLLTEKRQILYLTCHPSRSLQ